MDWLEQAWTDREEKIYPELFGGFRDNVIHVLDHTIFDPFQVKAVDPRWLTHGIFKFAPTPTRNSWIYVTSGLSNDWWNEHPNPDEPSGLGCELVLETPADCDWAMIHLSRLLAFQLLLGWGHYEGREPLSFGDRIPFRVPIDGKQSELTYGLIVPPPPSIYPAGFQLLSGGVEFLHVVGVTESEAAFSREHGYEALLPKLASLITDPARHASC